MGVALPTLHGFVELFRKFGPLGRTIQIGRQGLYVPDWNLDAADDLVRSTDLGRTYRELAQGASFADERLLPAFGASPILSADADEYEGAQIIHDFNDPIAVDHHQSFDTIIDGGSLEHIFNVPMALSNMMNMLRVGGRLLTIVPANNWLGHGFYQFGPEMFFRVFQPENGFRIHSLMLFGVDGDGTSRQLADLGSEGIRNEIGWTAAPVDLVSIAVKEQHVRPFRRWPIQGDYASAWDYVAKQNGRQPRARQAMGMVDRVLTSIGLGARR